MACECAGIAGRMKTIIPHPDVEPAPLSGWFFLFCFHLCAFVFIYCFIIRVCFDCSDSIGVIYSVLIISVMDMRIGFVCERRDCGLIVFSLFSL